MTPAEDLLIALSHSYPNLHAIVTGYPPHGQTAATREAAQVEACSLLRDALDASMGRPVYDAAVEWQRAHAERHPNLTETIGTYCRLEDAVTRAATCTCPWTGSDKRCPRHGKPTDPDFATVSRCIRAIRTWTPNARKMLAAAMGAEFPAEANRDATLRAVSERKRRAQRRELRRLNERLAATRGALRDRYPTPPAEELARLTVDNARLRYVVQAIEVATKHWDRDTLAEEVRKRCRVE